MLKPVVSFWMAFAMCGAPYNPVPQSENNATLNLSPIA
jgi:hypothetical protein